MLREPRHGALLHRRPGWLLDRDLADKIRERANVLSLLSFNAGGGLSAGVAASGFAIDGSTSRNRGGLCCIFKTFAYELF